MEQVAGATLAAEAAEGRMVREDRRQSTGFSFKVPLLSGHEHNPEQIVDAKVCVCT